MIFICTKAKYGFCKFGKGCEKIHFTDTCENPYCNGWQCDKRHPVSCFYFDKFGRCKFGSYCSYKHKENREKILEEEVLILKKDINKTQKGPRCDSHDHHVLGRFLTSLDDLGHFWMFWDM